MKTVLINGGSRGIGRECVRLFRKEGWNVVFTYNNSEEAASLLVKETGAVAIKADSRSECDVARAVGLTVDTFGGIDCLVNSAAVCSFSLITDLTLDEWNDTLAVNLTGVFLYTRAVSREMIRKKQGRIINISSMWGLVGSSCESHYSATKAGVIGLTKALAKELGPSGITVNAVAPGVINTEMNSALSEDDLKALSDETPLCRIGEPCEIADAVLFLASEKASFITGEVLNISGGFIV